MLLFQKYRPNSFNEFVSHLETVQYLNKYTLETVPNLIFYGKPGHGRRTMVYALLSNLFGETPKLKEKTSEIKAGATTMTVRYLESDEVVEICPSSYGSRDRVVVQSIIKELAESKPILSMFGNKKHALRVIIIESAEDLSRDAQAALRRTIEMYSKNFRIFMICSEMSKIMEPIKSRCLIIRIRGFRDEEIKQIGRNILEKEGTRVPDGIIDEIVDNSHGNGKRAICLLEFYLIDQDERENKRKKSDMKGFRLDWEEKLDNIAKFIGSQPSPNTFLTIRKEFYDVLNLGISADTILLYLFRRAAAYGVLACKVAVEAALKYGERLQLGNKPLYHLEAFMAELIVELAGKVKMI